MLTTFVLAKVLSICLPLSNNLQTKNINLSVAQNADSVKDIIGNIRKNAVYEFKTIFDEVKSKNDKLNIELIFLVKKMLKNRCNIQVNSFENSLGISLFIPCIDNF